MEPGAEKIRLTDSESSLDDAPLLAISELPSVYVAPWA
jgi:hypothetical protein